MKTITLRVDGMSCGHCEQRVCKNLLKKEGVNGTSASHKRNIVMVRFNEDLINEQDIAAVITKSGYEII